MAKKLQTDLERVARKYLADSVSGCWIWQGRLDKDGYAAQAKVGSTTDGSRRFVRPHRFMYESLVGAIQAPLVPDHLCRNRACGNPWHMEPVTRLVNHERGLRAMRSHCPKGHEISGGNEIRFRGGHKCRICFNEGARFYQKRDGRKHQKAYRTRKRGT